LRRRHNNYEEPEAEQREAERTDAAASAPGWSAAKFGARQCRWASACLARWRERRGLLFYRLIEGALLADPHPYKTLLAAAPAA
jgi:hypothetical protein